MGITKVVRWIVAVGLALTFMGSAIPKLTGSGAMDARFEAWGYPAAFAIVIGIVELVGGFAVLVPRFAFLGSVLLSVNMMGAVFTHLRSGIGSPSFAIAMLVLAAGLAWLTRPRPRTTEATET